MKKVMLIAALFMVTAARAEPPFESHTIADAVHYGGMPTPVGPEPAQGVRILDSGDVIYFRGQAENLLAKLKPEAIQALSAQAQKLSLLKTSSRSVPRCEDAGESLYRVRDNAGRGWIVRRASCGQILDGLPNNEEANLVALLDGFWRLGVYLRR